MKSKVDEIIETEFNENRRVHTKGVIQVIDKIANAHNISQEKAYIAAAFHDYSKATMTSDEEIIFLENKGFDHNSYPKAMHHGFVSAFILKEQFDCEDEEIFDAIYYHVSGNEKMSDLAKILYIADTCEPGRPHGYVDIIYKTAINDIDEALKIAVKMKSEYTLSKGKSLHENTIKLMKELGV